MVQRELTGERIGATRIGSRTLPFGMTDLLQVVLPAATRGDLDAIKSFVKSDKRWVHAVRAARETTARLLLKKGASPHAANDKGRTVADIAASTRRPEIRALARILKRGRR